MVTALIAGTVWYFVRNNFVDSGIYVLEPMLVGLFFALAIHFYGFIIEKFFSSAKTK